MIYNAEKANISIAVGGDAMITRRMTPFKEPEFLELVDILRAADVSIVNLEMLFHDYESSWQWSGTTYTRSDPNNLKELHLLPIFSIIILQSISGPRKRGAPLKRIITPYYTV